MAQYANVFRLDKKAKEEDLPRTFEDHVQRASSFAALNSLSPGKTKLIKFPPSRAGKDVKCPGYARGGCLSFDLTGT